MSENLFESFKSVSKADWKTKITADLKGKDYGSTLFWKSEEGIQVEPFYHAEDLQDLLAQYDNGDLAVSSKIGNHWKVIEQVKVENGKQANIRAITTLNNGAEAIVFDLQSVELTEALINELIEGILIEVAPVSFTNFKGNLNGQFSDQLVFEQDVITEQLYFDGSFDEDSFSDWKTFLIKTNGQSLHIDTAVYQNAGAKITEQLAFAIALGNEYLNQLSETEIAAIKTCSIKMAIGSNFFFEIAKLRAIRKLWQVLCDQYGIRGTKLNIQAVSTGINKSSIEANNNMLRNTSECMSAVIGGVDGVSINAHNSLMEDNEKGRRWARNISHILRNESYFDKVNDPTKGSYYIETLTEKLAEEAWQLFQSIEKDGGFLKSWKNGTIQDLIIQNKQAQIEAFTKGEKVLIGVNKYGHSKEVDLITPAIKSDNVLEPLNLSEF